MSVAKVVRLYWTSFPAMGAGIAVCRIILIGLLSCLMVACGGESSHEQALRKRLDELDKQSNQPVEPLPPFPKPKHFIYNDTTQQSPFELPKVVSQTSLQPDTNRPKEELESFALDSLRMVGIIIKGDKSWALVAAPNGTIYRVTVGNYMGQNFGKVTKIDKDKIELEETVPDGMGGWKKRNAEVALSDNKPKE